MSSFTPLLKKINSPADLKQLKRSELPELAEEIRDTRGDDIGALAHPVLRHRVLINYRAEAEGVIVDDLIDRILKSIKEGR